MKTLITHDYLLRNYGYDETTGLFWKKPEMTLVGELTITPYLTTIIDGELWLVHRLIWFYKTGKQPVLTIDHKNRIKLDNSWDNLRIATSRLQCLNMRDKKNKTGFAGVCWQIDRQKYQATIRVKGRRVNLGRFDSAEEASLVYEQAKTKLIAAEELFSLRLNKYEHQRDAPRPTNCCRHTSG